MKLYFFVFLVLELMNVFLVLGTRKQTVSSFVPCPTVRHLLLLITEEKKVQGNLLG